MFVFTECPFPITFGVGFCLKESIENQSDTQHVFNKIDLRFADKRKTQSTRLSKGDDEFMDWTRLYCNFYQIR